VLDGFDEAVIGARHDAQRATDVLHGLVVERVDEQPIITDERAQQ
jgi:hypothetical protein